VAKRGRPRGTRSWSRNEANVAAHHAGVLLEVWLAGAPISEIERVLLPWLAKTPNYPTYRAIVEECWRHRGSERRYTVPSPIKRKLCRLAILHIMELRLERIEFFECQSNKTKAIEQLIKTPDVDKVLEIVNKQAPQGPSLRRKARDRRGQHQNVASTDARQAAYDAYVHELENSWRRPSKITPKN
jgi:hypothetical protein